MLPRVALAVLVLAVAAAPRPAAAGAAPLSEIVRSAGFFQTDGERYAAWGDPGGTTLTVLDTKTNRTRVVAKPPECTSDRDDGGSSMWSGWMQLACDPPPPRPFYFLAIQLGTGRMASYRPGEAGPIPAPPPAGAPRCKLLRQASYLDAEEFERRWQSPYLLWQTHIPVGRDRLQPQLRLMRCGERPIVLQRGRTVDYDISGGLVSWQTGLNAWNSVDVDYRRSSAADRLGLYEVATRRRWSWALPWNPSVSAKAPPGTPAHQGQAWHTRLAVFWAAVLTRGADIEGGSNIVPQAWRVYEARVTR